MTEIANHVFGDVLTENPAVAQSAFGPHRVIPDRWKGMTPAQIEDVRRQQELQRQEKEVRNQFGFFIVIQFETLVPVLLTRNIFSIKHVQKFFDHSLSSF